MKTTSHATPMARPLCATLLAALLSTSLTTAAGAEPEGWKFEITPYIWGTGIEGDATVNGQKADFEKSFSDMFDYVEFSASVVGVVQYDRFLAWGQLDYFDLSTDALDVDDRPEGGRFDTTMLLTEAAVGYQLDGWAEGQTFDILVGARNLNMDADLEVYGHGTHSKDFDVTDPILVVRPSIPMFHSRIDGLRFNPTLAIGGGGDADLVYELQPQIQYQINKHVAARIGYRTVGYKVKGGKNKDDELNFNLSGLIAGIGMTF
jgi:opacity protein-like surface antigen